VNAADALGRLQRLHVPAITTSDAAADLGLSTFAASQTLRRLAASRLVTPVRKGLWALGDRPDPLVLIEYVTAPYPAYLSLQSALYQHGMIDQIPSMTYVVSLARTARVETPLATYSVHSIQPALRCAPGITLAVGLPRSVARERVEKIPSPRRRSLVRRRLDELLAHPR
jgi:predicted transcriptional regulator of viral defense system